MARILVPLPARDFDPTETGVPWRVLTERGHEVRFATPDGIQGDADPLMVTGKGLGLLATVLRANAEGRRCYETMRAAPAFQAPTTYKDSRHVHVDALMLPGGHAKGMRPYLESPVLQALVASFFEAGKPVAAICHGVLLAARSRRADGRSVLHGRRTTALTRRMEMTAWRLTSLYLGDYYRTYSQPLEDEVTGLLAQPSDFIEGPRSLKRDTPDNPAIGFTVRDRNYLSARWPGDAHAFALAFDAILRK